MDELMKILQDFGNQCYWYGEDTGDYSMKEILEQDFAKKTLWTIWALFLEGRQQHETKE